MTEARIPPQALDAEKQVIGAMLNDKNSVPEVIDRLRPEDFYSPTHQRYYGTMLRMFNEGTPIDLTTISEELRKTGEYNSKQDPLTLMDLTSSISGSGNVGYHATVVKERAIKRNLIVIGNDIMNKSFAETEDALDLLEYVQGEIYKIGANTFKKGARELKDILLDVSENIQKRDPAKGLTGIGWSIREKNEVTLGANNGDLIIIGGRPSMGKTSYALGQAIHMAQEKHVHIFSQEMSEEQLAIKLMASAAVVDHKRLKLNRLTPEEWQRVSRASGQLSKAKLYIDSTASLGLTELRSKATQFKNKGKCDIIFVDYLQLMKLPNNKDTMTDRIGELSKGLKQLAKELDVPVVALAQLNRLLENRTDKRPTSADLRSSGNIEQDADVIVLVHRPQVYGETKYKIGEQEYLDMDGFTSLIISKNRDGDLAEIPLKFNRELGGVFHSYDRHLPVPPPPQKQKYETPF